MYDTVREIEGGFRRSIYCHVTRQTNVAGEPHECYLMAAQQETVDPHNYLEDKSVVEVPVFDALQTRK
jgi:hypothetical protein